MTPHPDSRLIDLLGGTAAVARLCNIRMPSVSGWRRRGISDGWRKYLELLRPDVFSSQSATDKR